MADKSRTVNALRGLRRTAAQSRMKEGGDSPSLTIILGMNEDENEERDPNTEDWDKVDDSAPTMPGVGSQERKRRRTGG